MHEGAGRQKRLVDNLDAARALFAPVFERARDERLCIAHLDAAQGLIGIRFRYATGGQPVRFTIRGIIADTVTLGTSGLILAHNHPSGDPTPSPTDIDAMRSLAQAARPIGVAIRDHLVFGGGRFVSFRQRGLL